MVVESQANATGGTQSAPAPGPGSEGGGFSDGDEFWRQNQGLFERIRGRGGPNLQVQERDGRTQIDPNELEEFKRWKQAREAKDTRALFELGGLQPRDALDAVMFGGEVKEPPKPDPVDSIRSELMQLKESIEAERKTRQTQEESIREARAKSEFVRQVRSMEDLTVLQRWGEEAFDTAWNVFIQASEEAHKRRQSGENVPMPSLRQAAIQVENYLRQQASRLGEVMGAKAQLEPLPLSAGPSQGAATAPQSTPSGAGIGPTLTNVGGHAGAQPQGQSREELRQRALEAAKRLRT